MDDIKQATKDGSIFEAVVFPLVLVGFVYFFGFSYLTAYFKFFGIKLAEINPSDKEVFVSGFYAFFNYFNLGAPDGFIEFGVIFILISLLLVCLKFLRLSYSQIISNRAIQILFLMPIIFLGHQISLSAGVLAAQRDLLTLPEVMIVKANEFSKLSTTSKAGEQQILSIDTDRLIYANADSLFIYRQRDRSSTPVLIRLTKDQNLIVLSPRSKGPGL